MLAVGDAVNVIDGAGVKVRVSAGATVGEERTGLGGGVIAVQPAANKTASTADRMIFMPAIYH
jgi:hypothetical protein